MKPSRTKSETTVLCLANSWKHRGRCIAGKVLEDDEVGEWVRPVSARSGDEVQLGEMAYLDGGYPRILDLMRIQFAGRKEHSFQRENRLIMSGRKWRKVGEASWKDIRRAVDRDVSSLWTNDYSSQQGKNDQVPQSELRPNTRSLHLIYVPQVRIRVKAEYEGKIKVRANFRFEGVDYTLRVTDAVAAPALAKGGEGTKTLEKVALCISLGEVFQEFAYKLVAGVITQ